MRRVENGNLMGLELDATARSQQLLILMRSRHGFFHLIFPEDQYHFDHVVRSIFPPSADPTGFFTGFLLLPADDETT